MFTKAYILLKKKQQQNIDIYSYVCFDPLAAPLEESL